MEIYTPLTVEDYKAKFVDTETPHILVDVRTEEEFDEFRIPGAINIPLEELTDRMEEFEDDAETVPVVMVCRTGVRSIMGAQMLRYSGLDEATIYNLEEGTMGWGKRGLPLDKGDAE